MNLELIKWPNQKFDHGIESKTLLQLLIALTMKIIYDLPMLESSQRTLAVDSLFSITFSLDVAFSGDTCH
jgi:hypothetical protein